MYLREIFHSVSSSLITAAFEMFYDIGGIRLGLVKDFYNKNLLSNDSLVNTYATNIQMDFLLLSSH